MAHWQERFLGIGELPPELEHGFLRLDLADRYALHGVP